MADTVFSAASTLLIVGGAAGALAVADPASDGIGEVIGGVLSAGGVVLVFVAVLAAVGAIRRSI